MITTMILKKKAPDPNWVDIDRIVQKCEEAFPNTDWAALFADPKYITCTKNDMLAFLEKDRTNKNKYQNSIFDCDDFAAILVGEVKKWRPGQCFGEIWLDEHAECIWYCAEEDCLYLIEPQSDLLTRIDEVEQAPDKIIMVKM